MAVAWTDDAVGSTQQKLIVREPVVMDLSLPRFLSPGDHALATLELDNVSGAAGVYNAIVKGFQGLVLAFEHAFNLGHGQRVIQTVPMTAPGTVGVSNVHIALNGQGYKFDDDFQIQTRLGWGPKTRTQIQSQAVNTTYTAGWFITGGPASRFGDGPGVVFALAQHRPRRRLPPRSINTPMAAPNR